MKQQNSADRKGNDGYAITNDHCVVRLICVTILSFFLAFFTWFFTLYERLMFKATGHTPENMSPAAIFYEKWSGAGFALPIILAVFGALGIRYMKKGVAFECVVGFGLVCSVIWTIFCVIGWLASYIPWTGPLNAPSH